MTDSVLVLELIIGTSVFSFANKSVDIVDSLNSFSKSIAPFWGIVGLVLFSVLLGINSDPVYTATPIITSKINIPKAYFLPEMQNLRNPRCSTGTQST
jgi:predicted metallopeptidase